MKAAVQGDIAENEFYHIEVRPPREFKRFRIARSGSGIERVGGQCENDVWKTVKWLVSKEFVHVENGRLVADNQTVRELFDTFDSEPRLIKDNRFNAKEREKMIRPIRSEIPGLEK